MYLSVQGQEGDPQEIPIGKTPLKKKINFGPDGNLAYQIRVFKAAFSPHDEKVAYELQSPRRTKYHVDLKRVYNVIDLLQYIPAKDGDGVRLSLQRIESRAYLDTAEKSANAENLMRVTEPRGDSQFLMKPALSPTEDLLVVPVVTVERRPREDTYRVMHGDKLEELADRFGSSVEELAEMNGLEKESIKANQRLQIPEDFLVSHLWRQPTYPSQGTQITFGQYLDLDPAFSADGKHVFFSSPRVTPNPTLWRTGADGSGGITKITQSLSEDYAPSVSAAADFVAYASNPPRALNAQIWKCGTEGTLATQMCDGQSPAISPDVLQIAFVRLDERAGVRRVYLMNSNGTGETQLTRNNDYDAIDPAWSPEGEWIAFASNQGLDDEENRNFDIWVMRPDGTQMTQVTTNGSWDDKPVWDRSGKAIYFRSNRGGSWQIWRVVPKLPQEPDE